MLKYSVAVVALLAGTSLACAQQPDHGSNNSGAGMSNSASEHAPGQMKDNGSAKESGSAKDLAPGQNKGDGNSAKDQAPGRMKDGSASKSDDKSNEHRSQNETDRSGKDADRNAKNTSDHAKGSDHNAKNDADRNSKNSDRNARDEGSSDHHNGMKKDEFRNEHSRSNSSTGASEGSEGRSGAKGSVANVTAEQKTRIKTIFSRHHVEPARNLNVSVNVGVRLPHSVHLYPVPEDIIVIVPDYRGYEYIMLGDDRVAIVDPDTFEVVDIIVIA